MRLRRRDGAPMTATLTTEHGASSYGRPVLVLDDGTVLGPLDVVGYQLLDATPEERSALSVAGYAVRAIRPGAGREKGGAS
jgi:hypothetical protein